MTTDAGSNETHQAQVALWKLLQGSYFTLAELENLCFELGLHWDDLSGVEQPSKTRALVQYYAGRGQLPVLRDAIAAARPNLHAQLDAIILPTADTEPQAASTHESWHFPFTHLSAGNFTGRTTERKQLTEWLTSDAHHPLLVIRALGGFGKSELTWHWLNNDVDPTAWPCAMWWSFYETNAKFDQFLDSALAYLRINVPTNASLHERVDALLNEMSHMPSLLVLDGFERELCAYSNLNAAYQGDAADEDFQARGCVDRFAERFLQQVASRPNLRAKVLMTTRLRPSALELRGGMLLAGCREIELRQLAPADAVALFRAVGIRGTRAEIEEACAPYGYHPLSLRLLAGVVLEDHRLPGDITVASRYNMIGDLVQRRNHILQLAYDSLTSARQRLLSRLACLRSAVSYDVLAAVEQPVTTLDADLRNLVERGLVQRELARESTGIAARYDLHPIVRRYAYDRLTSDARAATHIGWRDYFAAVPKVNKVQTLDDLAPVIELYHHMVRAGQCDEACALLHDRLDNPLRFQFDASMLYIELLRVLFPDGEDAPPRLKDKHNQAKTLNALGIAYTSIGQARRALQMMDRSNAFDEARGGKQGVAIGLLNAALDLLIIGKLHAAEANVSQLIALCREIKDGRVEAMGHSELGLQMAFRGAWNEAVHELVGAYDQFREERYPLGRGLTAAYRAQRWLLMARQNPLLLGDDSIEKIVRKARVQAENALGWANGCADLGYPVERQYVEALWLLGAAQRLNGNLTVAERHLTEALMRCCRINSLNREADILIDLARLRAEQGDDEEVARLLDEALIITERCEYVLQGADVHLELAKLALRKGDRAAALVHAQQARKLATCDGPPDYTYKVAYDEAGALLAQLGAAP